MNLWNIWICLGCWRRYEWKLDIQHNLWQYWISATVERDENVTRSDNWIGYIVKYVELLNEIRLRNQIIQLNLWQCWIGWVCWTRYECKLDIQLNLWQYWISATVERDENVKRDQTIEFVTLLNLWNYEWDISVKLEKTSEFANCWIKGTVE